MRFKEVTMRPYGTFLDRTLTFGDDARLHLIYGPNGAGKSTTLQALRSALFGLRPGARVHASADLRIGATLADEDGETVSFLRRASTKPRLWTPDDSEELPKETLAPLLGNLTRERFETLFGLDHAKMIEGGKELLEGEGEMGEALFGAMFGGQQLARIERRLKEMSKRLFVERSPNSRIHALRKERDGLDREMREASIRPAAYVKDRRRLAGLRSRQEELGRERLALRGHLDRLKTQARSLRSLEQLAAKERERAALAIARPLDAASAERVVKLLTELDALDKRGDERSKEILDLDSQLAELTSSGLDVIQGAAGDIEALIERRGAFRDAAARTPRLEGEIEAARLELASSDQGTSVDTVKIPDGESLATVSAEADRLADELIQAEGRAALAAEALVKAKALAQEAARRLDGLDDALEAKLSDALVDLAPFSGALRDLRSLALPSPAAIEERAEEERAETARARDLAQDQERANEERNDAQEALDRLASAEGGPPPTQEELQRAREERDELLRSVLGDDVPRATGVLDLERTVRHADSLSDRRTGASALAAEREAHEAALRRATASKKAADEALAELESSRASSLARWQAQLPGESFHSTSAAELEAWLPGRVAVLKEESALRREANEEHERCAREVALAAAAQESRAAELANSRESWTRWLDARGLASDLSPEAARRRLRGALGEAARDRELARLERDLEEKTALLAAFDADVAKLCQELEVQALDSEVEAELQKARAEERPEGTAVPCARMLRLEATLREASQRSTRSKEVEARLTSERHKAQASEARKGELTRSLKELCAQNDCATTLELRALAQGSGRAAMLEADIEGLKAELANTPSESAQAKGEGSEDLPDEPEALAAAVTAAQARLDELDQELSAGDREEGELRVRVEANGEPTAARLRARMAEIDAELAACAEEYVQAQLASRILTQEVERHREATRGPLLRRAEALFEVLTLGAYNRLQSAEEQNKEVMVAVTPGGRRATTKEMSDGTCDQLYLALRIASVEQMLKTVVMPFIADDLFVNFDDERTEAALRVLASLAESTQVIVFSHHRSVVATAERLGAEGVPIEVHHLQDERSREAAAAGDVAVR